MVFASYAALLLGQGMPFRGMVHDGTTFIQKDPLDNLSTYPVATTDGHNFVVSLGRRVPKLELLALDKDQPKLVSRFGKSSHAYRRAAVHANADGTFWVVAEEQKIIESGGMGENHPFAVLFDSSGKLKFQKTLDMNCSKAMLTETDKDGGLVILGVDLKKLAHRAAKLDTKGKIAWDIPVEVKRGYNARSIVFGEFSQTFFFSAPDTPSSLSPEDRGLSCVKLDSNGKSRERFTPIADLRDLYSTATAGKGVVYTAGWNAKGNPVFLALSGNAQTISTSYEVPRDKIGLVTTMSAHPTRGVFVGGQDGEQKPVISLFNYGGKRAWTQPASFGDLKGRVTKIAIDRFNDVYASGSTETGIFVTKIARSSGGGEEYRQLVTFGWMNSQGTAPMAVNSDTGEVLATSFGRVARFSQSPLLYTKVMDVIEGETLSRNVLEGDRYTVGGEVVIVVPPKNGTLKLNKDGKFTYTPKKGFVGADAFTYRVNKQSVSSFSGGVSIRIAAAPKNKS